MSKETFQEKLIVFTAPSGAGKTTIVRHLIKQYDFLGFSVSATNRKMREGEEEGKDYYFLSTEEFKEKIHQQEFVEWEEVYSGQYYGTLKSEIERLWSLKKYIIFDIEVNGASSIKEKFGDNAHVVFVKPPSLEILIQRLKNRKTETEASLKKRIRRVKRELSFENSFDYILVNDVLDTTLKEAEVLTESFFFGKLI